MDVSQPPQADSGDRALAIARAFVSGIPFAGGAAVEALQYVFGPPLERRRDQWMREVGESLVDLQARGLVNFDDLRNNEKFIDAVQRATQAAYRTHSEIKRTALRNAALNSALPGSPDEILLYIQLDRLERYTEWHLRILALLQAPDAVPQPPGFDANGLLGQFLELRIPALAGRADAYDRVWRDLYQEGLVDTQTPNLGLNGTGSVEKRTTAEGDEFLAFIKQP